MERDRFIVAVYDCDRAWGGPEEGGWWYDVGSLRRVLAVCKTREAACVIARRANSLLQYLQRDKPDLGSVICDGILCAQVFENNAPEGYPDVRPHYE